MNGRGRLLVLIVSVPIIAFAVIGGFMGNALASRQDRGYQALRIFEDVVTLIVNNYVEDVDVETVMHGAMHGLADGLDPDSAYLDAKQLQGFEKGETSGTAHLGLELTRQYYLRVIAARDGSPAARAGLLPGDYLRSIDGQSTRDTSVYEGMRLMRGTPGTKIRLTVLRGNAAEPHELELLREELPALPVKGKVVSPGTGSLRIAEFGRSTSDQIKNEVATLTKGGASRLVVDLRGTAFGEPELGLAAARLFVASGTLAFRQDRGKDKEAVASAAGDGAVTLPVAVLTDNGTSGAAELFAAALSGQRRATIVGARTLGRAARQKLVKLPGGSGLLLTHMVFLTPGGEVIHGKGLTPDIAVDQPNVDFGQPAPPGDPILEKAIQALAEKKVA